MKKKSKLIAVFTLVGIFFAVAGNSKIMAQNKRITCESTDGNYNYCRVDTDNNVRLERKISLSECRYGSSWGYDKRGIWVDRGCRAEFAYGGSSSGTTAATVGAVIGGLILAGAIASRNKDESKNYYSNQEVYDLGYRDGSSDAQRGLANNPDSHKYGFDSKYRDSFRSGYTAGYASVNAANANQAVAKGYAAGAQDARNNYSSDYSRYRSEYNWSTENDFRRGYNDGYRDNRNGWSSGNYGGDRVPNYFIGTFRGYTPSNNTYTDITIHADGSIRISNFKGDQANGYFQDGAAFFPWGRFRLKRENNGFTAVAPSNRAESVFYQRIR